MFGSRAGLSPQEAGGQPKPVPGRGEAEAYADWCSQHPEYSPSVVKEATALGTALVKAAGSWKEAVSMLRRVWTDRYGNNLDGLLTEEPEGLIDADLLAFLRETVREWVKSRAPLPPGRWRTHPHNSVKEHIGEAYEKNVEGRQSREGVVALRRTGAGTGRHPRDTLGPGPEAEPGQDYLGRGEVHPRPESR